MVTLALYSSSYVITTYDDDKIFDKIIQRFKYSDLENVLECRLHLKWDQLPCKAVPSSQLKSIEVTTNYN